MNNNCLFCKIANKQVPAEVVYEDENSLAFLDVQPRAPGHTLIIPKKHAKTVVDLPEGEIGPLFSAVKKVDEMVVGALGADGATVGWNQGAAAGQVVDHLHVHVIPRHRGDGGGPIQSVVDNKPEESLQEIRAKIAGKKLEEHDQS